MSPSRNIIDGHIHLSFVAADKREEFFAQGSAAGLCHYILGGYNPPDWQEQIKLQIEYKNKISTCFGLHPWHIRNSPTSQLAADYTEFVRLAKRADFIGETGIDRFNDISAAKDKLQVEYFRKHLQLARDYKKPVVLHVVKAHTEALEILDHFGGALRGIMHGFAGGTDLAKRYYKLGYLISVGPGILAPKGYRKLKAAVAELPLEYLSLESDSPQSPQDLSPNPRLLLDVAGAVAKLRKISREKVLQTSNENLLALKG